MFELLDRRELHLTAIALVSKHLTEENHRELLTAARGQTKQQILESLVRRFPKSVASSHFRRIPPGAVTAGPTATLEPRSAETYCLQLNTSRELKAKLEEACDLMSHANPSRDLAVVVERALDLLLQKLKARQFGQRRSRKTPQAHEAWHVERSTGRSDSGILDSAETNGRTDHFGQTGADHARQAEERMPEDTVPDLEGRGSEPRAKSHQRRHIPQKVRREVAARDGEKCCHVGPDGKRCEARAFLQLHHERPWALGGTDSAENLRLLCRPQPPPGRARARCHARRASHREPETQLRESRPTLGLPLTIAPISQRPARQAWLLARLSRGQERSVLLYVSTGPQRKRAGVDGVQLAGRSPGRPTARAEGEGAAKPQ